MANRWIVLVLVFLTRTSMGFQFQSVASVAPLMIADLRLSYAQLGTLIGLYMLPGAFFALPGGVIGQRFGERRVVVAGLALMVAGGALTAGAGGFGTAVAGRLLSGVGAVVMNILLAKMVSDWFAGKELSTAMAIMLTSWPVGLGLAAATLGGVAAGTSWRTAVMATAVVAALGLLMMLLCRDAPGGSSGPQRAALRRRELWLSITGGFAWGCFNASLVAIIAFGPGLLIARGATLGDAGRVVSLAIWVTMLSVPLGGYLTDRLKRPTLLIVTGSLVAAGTVLLLPVLAHAVLAFCLVGLAIGAPPGGLMALLPRTLPPERLATGFGVFYTVFYVMMALTQPAAGLVRDVAGDPAAPIVFAALVMAATVIGLAIFRRLERRPA
ncbi:MAG TPA: MFS transporter [Candidatus Acidoferrum sp.]|jgi:predicted MFS family arabinose efflux permease|nr:MFS transporter [Candidatus Acidoferrum sp.]